VYQGRSAMVIHLSNIQMNVSEAVAVSARVPSVTMRFPFRTERKSDRREAPGKKELDESMTRNDNENRG